MDPDHKIISATSRSNGARPLEPDGPNSALGRRPLLDRYTIQLPTLVLGVLALQGLVANVLDRLGGLLPSAVGTIAATQVANVIGAMIFREIRRIPGTRKFAFIFPAFIVPYAVLALTLLIFRFNYSVWLAFTGAVAGLGIIWLFNAILQVSARTDLFVKPSPMVDVLIDDVPRVRFHVLGDAAALRSLDGGTVIVDLREDLSPEWEREIAHAALRGVPVYHVKQAYESLTGRVRFDHLSENSFGSLIPAMSYIVIKQAIDFLVAAVLLILAALPMLAIGAAIRATSPGPAIFRQERVGYRGRSFEILKFRTMVVDDADPRSHENQVTRFADPRITPLGRFLRKARLDELPQLVNVLRGDMSLIGPRPEARALSEWYNRTLDFYDYRHIVRPGITGWAQVKLGHVTGVDDTFLKTQYDFYYIKNLSAWLDLLIVMKTLEIMTLGRGSR